MMNFLSNLPCLHVRAGTPLLLQLMVLDMLRRWLLLTPYFERRPAAAEQLIQEQLGFFCMCPECVREAKGRSNVG